METIKGFKNKKTGEVYGVGPKTWEFTVDGESMYDALEDGIPCSQLDGFDEFAENASEGDLLVLNVDMESSTGIQGFSVKEIRQITSKVEMMGMFMIGTPIAMSPSVGGYFALFITNEGGEARMYFESV